MLPCLVFPMLQLPGPLVSAVSKLLGPLLADQQGPSIVLASSTPAGPAAAGGLYGPTGGMMGGVGGGRGGAGGPAVQPSSGSINTLVSMGFSRDQAVRALQQSGNDVQNAIALLVGGG
jgi:hypothetical protein